MTTEISKHRSKMWTEQWVTSVCDSVGICDAGWRLERALANWSKKNRLCFSKPFLKDISQAVLRNSQLEAVRRWLGSRPPYFPVDWCIRLSLASKWTGYGGKAVGENTTSLAYRVAGVCTAARIWNGKWNAVWAEDKFSLKVRVAVMPTSALVQSSAFQC